ncbi:MULTISPECIES: hypothetical protein [Cryobacterium]|uniref:hypothetical protein n=1 Tax=Cryobacterium TaxID=69578 RepID=UPI000CD48853|nr:MULTISPECIES: hypothetical protein [Cryobacterium]POH63625.1 hypothetical protein C3B60_16030 [Cryobacterium zongtaii]TFC45586.1 hypothetical protein E3O57_08055 [Cryobacterium sp. TMN-39-2]
MAKLGSMTGTITVSMGNTALPGRAVEFTVPLRAIDSTTYADTTATMSVHVDRTELRAQVAKTLRTLADRIEDELLAPGAILLTCAECGSQLVTQSPAELRHEADGAHSLGSA